MYTVLLLHPVRHVIRGTLTNKQKNNINEFNNFEAEKWGFGIVIINFASLFFPAKFRKSNMFEKCVEVETKVYIQIVLFLFTHR